MVGIYTVIAACTHRNIIDSYLNLKGMLWHVVQDFAC